jgi:hypothetical protein
MHKASVFEAGEGGHCVQDSFCCLRADSLPLALACNSKPYLFALRSSDEKLYRFVAFSRKRRMPDPIERVDDHVVECDFVLRGRFPEQEWVDIKGDVLVQERDGEGGSFLRCGYPKVIE